MKGAPIASSSTPAGCLLQLIHGLDEGARDAKSQRRKKSNKQRAAGFITRLFISAGCDRDTIRHVAIECRLSMSRLGPLMHPLSPPSCFIGEMAYVVHYALHLIPVLPFQQKRQVLEPIKMPQAISRQCHQGIQLHECFAACRLAHFACYQPSGQVSFSCLVK